jgi:glycosyltransferase involved in cell wall biosynthesis
MHSSLVSVICISHNHGPFVAEAIDSVINQTYENIEIILVDDCSTDHSAEVIHSLKRKFPNIKTILLYEQIGNCKAFNRGLAQSKGDFIIDLAADDLLLPERIQEGLKCFYQYGEEYGVNYTDVAYINAEGKVLKHHYRRDSAGQLIDKVYEGLIYEQLLSRYFICTPTMMVRKSVFDLLGGYDENLSYEDFDFWVRTGKITKYCYTDKILVKKRVLGGSLSAGQYIRGSRILHSTYQVCLKAERINKTEPERMALVHRAQYEFRKSLFSGNYSIAFDFSRLLLRNLEPGLKKILVSILHRMLKIVGGFK